MTYAFVLSLLLAVTSISAAVAQSVKSCGGPNDHLKNPVIKLNPDPIRRGGTLTIEASGTLDEVISEFNTNVDLNIQALGVVHVTAKGAMPLSITPGAAKGPFSLTIGPFTLPSNVPGSAVVKGQVHVVNSKNEAVMCVDIDLNVPGAANEESLVAPKLDSTPLTTVSSCGKSTDHMPDFKVTTSGGAITTTGTLDEAVTKASIDLDVSIKVLFITVPLKLKIPFTTSAGLINKGPLKTVIGPSTVAISPNVKATLKGTVKLNDGNGEEITCVNVDAVVAADDHIVV